MSDKPKEHPESAGGASAPSPFDQPTERFTAVPDPSAPGLAHTDEDLDFGSRHPDSLPTEQIPAYRPDNRPPRTQPPALEDLPTTVIRRRDPVPPLPSREPVEREPVEPEREPVEPELVGEPATTVGPVMVPPPTASTDAVASRGTLDLGLLLLRLAVGGTLLVHGLQKLTGWWGGPGLSGFRDGLTAAGFDQAQILAVVGSVGEVAAGLLLILGLLTPAAAAGAVAVMINAWCLRQSTAPGLEYFAPEGIEYETVLLAASAALVLTGPGRLALDGRRRWATRPYVGSVVILLLGVATGLAVWFVLNGANPVI